LNPAIDHCPLQLVVAANFHNRLYARLDSLADLNLETDVELSSDLSHIGLPLYHSI